MRATFPAPRRSEWMAASYGGMTGKPAFAPSFFWPLSLARGREPPGLAQPGQGVDQGIADGAGAELQLGQASRQVKMHDSPGETNSGYRGLGRNGTLMICPELAEIS